MPEPIIHLETASVVDRIPKSDWEKTLDYFRSRESVLFLSYCRFWDKHGFTQQSLAKELANNGVKVTWVDTFEWHRYQPQAEALPNLEVRKGFKFPFTRWEWSRHWSTRAQLRSLSGYFQKYRNPLIWVQGGIDEWLAEALPHVDVFSTFDDPYRHSPYGTLAKKAKLTLCQNSFAYRLFQKNPTLRLELAFPPVKPLQTYRPHAWNFPANFPKVKMGYIGAFKAEDYDLEAFEYFVRSFPEIGFVLAGRTDAEGEAFLGRLRQYPNFFHSPWVPREQVASLWKELKVNLLLYKPAANQDGAFPIKVVESTFFSVPAVATAVPKTLDLYPHFPRCTSLSGLVQEARKMLATPPRDLKQIHRYFALKTDPQRHLMQVVQSLSAPPSLRLAA